jgi:hypothetical protein
MRLMLGAVSLLLLLLPNAGCLVLRGYSQPHSLKGAPACHPSQYWDGAQCRHKGKGHGARKHDGVAKR